MMVPAKKRKRRRHDPVQRALRLAAFGLFVFLVPGSLASLMLLALAGVSGFTIGVIATFESWLLGVLIAVIYEKALPTLPKLFGSSSNR